MLASGHPRSRQLLEVLQVLDGLASKAVFEVQGTSLCGVIAVLPAGLIVRVPTLADYARQLSLDVGDGLRETREVVLAEGALSVSVKGIVTAAYRSLDAIDAINQLEDLVHVTVSASPGVAGRSAST